VLSLSKTKFHCYFYVYVLVFTSQSFTFCLQLLITFIWFCVWGIIISFTNGSPAEVKGFLEDYIARKDKLGYIIAEESFSEFYEAVCTKLDWVGKRTNNEDDDLTPRRSPSL